MSQREDVRFRSGAAELAAWHHRGTNGACVVMAGGFAVPRGPGTDRFAARFHAAGFSVLAFDHRRTGDSGGRPRGVLRVRDQLADWHAAIAAARALPGVDPDRIALWSFSVTAGHLFHVAARDARLAAVVAQTPNADGPAATRNALRYQHRGAAVRLTARGLADAAGSLVGRPPLPVPLVGPPGSVVLLSTPDVADTTAALDPDGRYPEWDRTVAARSALRIGAYRPGRSAARVGVPLLVVVADDDRTALAEPAARAARRAPRGELVRLPGNHYAPFLAAHEQAVRVELEFLQRHLLARGDDAVASVDAAVGSARGRAG